MIKSGYAKAWHNGKTVSVTRVVAKALNRPTKVVMHLCNNGHLGCVEPTHLRLGTPKQNAQHMLRSGNHAMARRSHCKNGHPFDGRRAGGSRRCLVCHRNEERERRQRKGK